MRRKPAASTSISPPMQAGSLAFYSRFLGITYLPVCLLGLEVTPHMAACHATYYGGQGVQCCVMPAVL